MEKLVGAGGLEGWGKESGIQLYCDLPRTETKPGADIGKAAG